MICKYINPKTLLHWKSAPTLGMFIDFLKLFTYNLRAVLFNYHTYEGVIEGFSHFGWLDSIYLAGAYRTATKNIIQPNLINYTCE